MHACWIKCWLILRYSLLLLTNNNRYSCSPLEKFLAADWKQSSRSDHILIWRAFIYVGSIPGVVHATGSPHFAINSRCERADEDDNEESQHDTLELDPTLRWLEDISTCASLLVLTVFLTTTIWDRGFRDSLLI